MTTLIEPGGRPGDLLGESDPVERPDLEEATVTVSPEPSDPLPAPRPSFPPPRRIVQLVGLWVLVVIGSVGVIVYGLGPVLAQRHQRALLRDFRVEVDHAANAVQSLRGYEPPKVAPELGSAVAIIDIGRLRQQQVVVEGAGSSQTERGPGHVPGTAGPGQPGNSVVVGRRLGFAGPFRGLGSMRTGDRIVVTTPQGQSVYAVDKVRQLAPDAATYGPTKNDRLTLLTSSSTFPTSAGSATVVTATMVGAPFAPTPQGGLSAATDGRHGDASAWPLLILLGICFASVVVAAVVLYRRWRPLSTYLLTTPAMVALAILFAEAAVRLLPAWA